MGSLSRRDLPTSDASGLDREWLQNAARNILDARDRRSWFFPRAAFDETAWEVLLLLYTEEPSAPSLQTLACATLTRLSTARRWVQFLVQEGLVSVACNRPGHETVRLTRRGRELLDSYLLDRVERTQERNARGTGEQTLSWYRAGWAVIVAAIASSALTYVIVTQ